MYVEDSEICRDQQAIGGEGRPDSWISARFKAPGG